MSKARRLSIKPLLGPITSLSGGLIGQNYATASRNARVENGAAKNRYGFKSIKAAQAGFVAGYGLHYCRGLSSSGSVARENVSFEDVAGTVKPWSRHITTHVPTAITDGASALSLHASQWRRLEWEDTDYFFNPDDSTYKLAEHVVGTLDSFTAIKPPAAPADPLTVEFVKNTLTGDTASYRILGYTGVDTTNSVTLSGTASGGETKTITGGGALRIQLGASKLDDLRIVVEFDEAGGPGAQDFSQNDVFKFGIGVVDGANVPLRFDPDQVKVSWTNAAASGFPLEVLVVQVEAWSYQVIVRFDPAAPRASRDDCTDLTIDLVITASSGTSSLNKLEITPFTIGGVNPDVLPGGDGTGKIAWYGGYKNNTTGQESELGPPLETTEAQWKGALAAVVDGKEVWFGTVFNLIAVASAESGTDRWVLRSRYSGKGVTEPQDIRVHGEYVDSGGTLEQRVTTSVAEWLALPGHLDSTAPTIDTANIKCACAHNGGAVWGMGGGTANLRFSYIGQPLRLFSEFDGSTPDDVLGNDLTMAPDLSDEPVALHSAGGSLIALGSRGVYVTYGLRPQFQSPTWKLPESNGVAGPNASCVWRDDSGAPGVAFLSSNLDTVWFVRVLNAVDRQNGYELVEASIEERGAIKAWLFSSAPTSNLVFMGVDERADALWVRYGNRGVVFRRQNLADGKRPWEYYDYTVTGTMGFCSFSGEYGLRSMRSTGAMDEVEYDSTASFVPIEGTLRDAGAAMPESSWTAKVFGGRRRRVLRARIERQTLTDLMSLTVISTRQTSSALTVASGGQWVKCDPLQQGQEHSFKVTMPEGSGELRGIHWDECDIDEAYAS